MARILGVGTALPEYRITQNETRAHLTRLLGVERAARFASIVEAGGNETRYSVLPIEKLLPLKTIEERSQLYVQHAVPLAARAAHEALGSAGIAPGQIDLLLCVSSTGYMMPSLDAHLANHLGVRARCRRFSLNQIGCAGGVASLSMAAEMLHAPGKQKALVVSVETPWLSLQVAEPSPTDILSSTQFGDGAGAAVLSADGVGRAPEIISTQSVLAPGTIERDGIRLTSSGLRLMRQRGLTRFVRGFMPGAVRGFLAEKGLDVRDVSFWLIHPRSSQVLATARECLGLEGSALDASWAVWERCGNVISASMFFILRELQETRRPSAGNVGMMVAIGAGMSCEMALLRSEGWLSREG